MRESEKAATAITSDSVATGSRANWNPAQKPRWSAADAIIAE
jgi:hypothetical protein